MMSLTPQESACLAYLRLYQAHQNMAPTVRDITVAMGLKSSSGAHRLLNGLEERGHIRRLPKKRRAIEIIEHRCPSCGHHLNSKAGSKTAVGSPGDIRPQPNPPVAGGPT